MFTNISWGNYIVVVVLLGVSWYLFVGLRFYFAEIKDIATGKRKFQFRSYPEIPSNSSYQESPDSTLSQSYLTESDQTFKDVDHLVERLKNVVADAAQRKLHQQEFVDYLGLVLIEYPSVKNSPFRSSVSELIVSECDKLESIHLTQQEAEGLWNEKN
ncbi:hypothetical protein ACM55F_14210 [Flavobacterium sp. XS2P12]|uniref:hypothetical protein n=1 Tax=Flavobacterium melibiosi TaxID=3398734 RepID=UPI003A8AAA47